MRYKALPDGLIIKNSKVNGLGLFAVSAFKAGTVLGTSHIRDKRFKHNFIRTPLGGFINHSDDPNLKLIGSAESRDIESDILMVKTIKDIEPGEELFTKYSLYNIDDNDDNHSDIDLISGTESAYLRD